MTPRQPIATEKAVAFRYSYVILPLALFLLSVALTVYFYPALPPTLAYRFNEGPPDKWAGREAMIAWLLVPQFALTLLSSGITLGIVKLSRRFPHINGALVGRVLVIMGNMFGLPQLIISFATLDIFLYNSYKIHIMSFLTFALLVMGIGVIALGISFILALRRVGFSPLRQGSRSSK